MEGRRCERDLEGCNGSLHSDLVASCDGVACR